VVSGQFFGGAAQAAPFGFFKSSRPLCHSDARAKRDRRNLLFPAGRHSELICYPDRPRWPWSLGASRVGVGPGSFSRLGSILVIRVARLARPQKFHVALLDQQLFLVNLGVFLYWQSRAEPY
jgi:hypothetical protein